MFAGIFDHPAPVPPRRYKMPVPTVNILGRVLMVESQDSQGSIFCIDVDEREYWVTARHVVTGVTNGPPYGAITATRLPFQLLNSDATSGELDWIDVDFTVLNPEDEDVDVMVLAAPAPVLSNPLPSLAADADGAPVGVTARFLGSPTVVDGSVAWLARGRSGCHLSNSAAFQGIT
jgi:hypothetical protein